MSKKYEKLNLPKIFWPKRIPGIGHLRGLLYMIDDKNLIDEEKGLDENGLYEHEFDCYDGNTYRIKGSKPILVREHFVRAE